MNTTTALPKQLNIGHQISNIFALMTQITISKKKYALLVLY